MPGIETAPVEDSVAKIGNDLAVGEDLEFQRKWWRFEKITWVCFVLIVLLDLAGAFGRGPLAKAKARSEHGTMAIEYERIERFSTPSILTIHFEPAAVHDGKIQLWVSDPIIKQLGNQRIVPQPVSSVIGDGGITYTFQSTPQPNSVEFALEPASPGVSHFELQIPSTNPGASVVDPPMDKFRASVVVMP